MFLIGSTWRIQNNLTIYLKVNWFLIFTLPANKIHFCHVVRQYIHRFWGLANEYFGGCITWPVRNPLPEKEGISGNWLNVRHTIFRGRQAVKLRVQSLWTLLNCSNLSFNRHKMSINYVAGAALDYGNTDMNKKDNILVSMLIILNTNHSLSLCATHGARFWGRNDGNTYLLKVVQREVICPSNHFNLASAERKNCVRCGWSTEEGAHDLGKTEHISDVAILSNILKSKISVSDGPFEGNMCSVFGNGSVQCCWSTACENVSARRCGWVFL